MPYTRTRTNTKGIYIWVPATLIDIDEYQSDHRIRTSDGILCVSASLFTSHKCRCPCNARFRGRSLVYDCYMMWLQKNLKNCAYFNI